jgi:phage shock protein PspC (stress-responsive transcriptional regulator)
MKKTISINLQGVIFHVEEDGYQLLHTYLGSVKRYFAAYEGHEEIMADLEGRMAEIFLSKLSTVKQVITLEEVQALIQRMGNVQDFAEVADETEPHTTSHTLNNPTMETFNTADAAPKRLYKAVHGKKIAGVAAGIAHYLKTDPLWVRLAFILLVFGTPVFDFGAFASISIITYIVLALILPVDPSIPAEGADMTSGKGKKLYRNPDDKKLGGVSSGIAAYFGTDPTWIRLLFVVLFFGFGTGLLLYIILWMVLPEANSLTEKMEMRGNPITISSIEDTIKNNPSFQDEKGQQNTLARLFLLPITLLSQILEAVGPLLKTLISVFFAIVRVIAGALMIMLSLALMFGAVVLAGAGFGLLTGNSFAHLGDFPTEMVSGDVPWYGVLAAAVGLIVPAILLGVLGLSVLARRTLMRQPLGWTLLALFLVSGAVVAFSAIEFGQNFNERGTYSTERKLMVPAGTLFLKAGPSSGKTYKSAALTIGSSRGQDILLQMDYMGEGRTEEDAVRNAQMVKYEPILMDSVLTLATSIGWKENAKFRDQDLNVRLLIPTMKPFLLDRNLARIVNFNENPTDIDLEELAGKKLMFGEGGKLSCLDCTAADSARQRTREDRNDFVHDGEDSGDLSIEIPSGGPSRTFEVASFTSVEAAGALQVLVRQGSTSSVKAYGSQSMINDLKVRSKDGQLSLSLDGDLLDLLDEEEPVVIVIETIKLTGLDLVGACKGEVSGFSGLDLNLDLIGASRAYVKGNQNKITADLTGASKLELSGTADEISADLTGACKLNAEDMPAQKVKLDLSGASKAIVHSRAVLNVDANGASRVTYYGQPETVVTDLSGAAKVEQE